MLIQAASQHLEEYEAVAADVATETASFPGSEAGHQRLGGAAGPRAERGLPGVMVILPLLLSLCPILNSAGHDIYFRISLSEQNLSCTVIQGGILSSLGLAHTMVSC